MHTAQEAIIGAYTNVGIDVIRARKHFHFQAIKQKTPQIIIRELKRMSTPTRCAEVSSYFFRHDHHDYVRQRPIENPICICTRQRHFFIGR